jgi:hypothetical protein
MRSNPLADTGDSNRTIIKVDLNDTYAKHLYSRLKVFLRTHGTFDKYYSYVRLLSKFQMIKIIPIMFTDCSEIKL